MKVKWLVFILFTGAGLAGGFGNAVYAQQKDLAAQCSAAYVKTGKCPDLLCRLDCVSIGGKSDSCAHVCQPVKCTDIPADKCPTDYCSMMMDCSGKKICHFQMLGEKAQCGDLAYAGQDVECCPGLIRRCGIEFLDGACDMEGKNSIYNLPICVPCGDKICGNFENRCNCPEDCGTAPKHGGKQP